VDARGAIPLGKIIAESREILRRILEKWSDYEYINLAQEGIQEQFFANVVMKLRAHYRYLERL
jgi:chorismate-pyruvate lyase